MNVATKARSLLIAAAVIAALPKPARAVFGVGDIVFDPENTAQTINLLQQAQQEFDRLGSLLGVSTQQFDQLLQLTAAVGNAQESAQWASPLTAAQLLQAIQAVPGLESSDLNALFDVNGLLDAFMGVPVAQWAAAIEQPNTFYRSVLVDPAIARIGGSLGASLPAIAYAQWYAARTPEDQFNSRARTAVDFSNLLGADWLGSARIRRVNLEGLSAAGQDASHRADGAQTAADLAHSQAKLSANSNAILLEAAAQNADAQEATVRAIHAQSAVLMDEAAERRNGAEMRLDAEQ